jgi:hypothetical protein
MLGDTPLTEGNLYFRVDIKVFDTTPADQKVNLDQIGTAITTALTPLFSQLPCVDVNLP